MAEGLDAAGVATTVARKQRKAPGKSGARKTSVAAVRTQVYAGSPKGTTKGLLWKWRVWIAASLAAGIVLLAGLAFQFRTGGTPVAGQNHPPTVGVAEAQFVGSETCAGCHRVEAELWHGSQHKHAMAHATETSVLGDFADARFDDAGMVKRFFRRDNKFLVETDGADGKPGVFEVKYTFGLYPLQQYLIEFPDGRLQALTLAWDSRAKDQGGQRWFNLYPNEQIRHDDVLHWTKLNQNWNFMCAECHSTGVRKNYDAAQDRFATTFAEISVGCEACHGRGSRHVAWARQGRGNSDDSTKGLVVRFDERAGVSWTLDPTTNNAKRSVPASTLRKEVETCGLCHARRGAFSEDWVPGRWLSDTHTVSPLGRGLYHADGQMLDEVYNYGSFKQSKMFAAGVTCSDCHEPHSAKPRLTGDNLCLQCHAAGKYANATHHHHQHANPPPSCTSCHMPTQTYMVVDQRHDHSFRVPRPDLSAKLGTPNACSSCHANKAPDWAAAAIEGWYGPNRKGFQNYAEAFHAAWSDRADAAALLAAVVADPQAPAISRAGALDELGSRPPSATSINLAQKSLVDPEPMVRIGALNLLAGLPLRQRWTLAAPLLSDRVRGVRFSAVSLLAATPTAQLPVSERRSFESAAAEFIAAQRLNADRPEARMALANFYAQRGSLAEAEAEYQAALRLSPQYAPAYVNLADLYRQTGRDNDAERMLRTAVAVTPGDAGVHHALGLALVRLKRLEEALGELRKATELAPEQGRYSYVHGVALHSAGQKREALTVLKGNLARHPNDRETLLALISFSRDIGERASALEYAQQLARLAPGDPHAARHIEELQRQDNKPAER